MKRLIVQTLFATALVAGTMLGASGLSMASPLPDNGNNDIVDINLPVNQDLVSAHNNEDGYQITVGLLPGKTGKVENKVTDSGALGGSRNSPGIVSDNVVQIPVHVPINACGNTVSIVGLLNPEFGNNCVNS